MRENCQWKDRCVFCETYGHCAVEVHDIHYRNGHIFAFQIFSPHDKNIKIKGIMDNRYFEEIENPLQYYMNGKLHWGEPENPYPKGTAKYANYEEMLEKLPPMEKFIDELTSTGSYIEKFDGYNMKVEEICNYNEKTGIVLKLTGNKVMDGKLLDSYYNYDLLPKYYD